MSAEQPPHTSPHTVPQAPVYSSPQPGAPAAPPAEPTGPQPVEKSKSGMSIGLWVAIIVGAIILVLLTVFIVQNSEPAQFQYFGASFELPLGVAMLLAALAGIVIAGIGGLVRIMLLSHRLKKANRALEGVSRSIGR